jgi:hypothetical protein
MARNNYIFCDMSHWKYNVIHQGFANAGHRCAIVKASDSYNMPDKNDNYTWYPQKHYDAFFVDNVVGFRSVGLAVAGYHFARFDRPLNVSRHVIVEKNLEYYLEAINMLPDAQRQELVQPNGKLHCAVLDMEQSASQLEADGLSPKSATMNDMAWDMVQLFAGISNRLIMYSYSYWPYHWLSTATLEKIAGEVLWWEAEYPSNSLSLDKQHVGALRTNYVPSVPPGFTAEFMTKADEPNGRLFAWQFNSGSKFPEASPENRSFDINATELDKVEIFKIFGTDGAVDPPPPSNGEPIDLTPVHEQLDAIQAQITQHDLDIKQALSSDTSEPDPGEDPPNGEDPPDPETGLFVRVGEEAAFVSYAKNVNEYLKPIYEWWPGDTSDVADRCQIKAESVIPIVKGGRKQGDGGVWCFEIDRERFQDVVLTWGSAPIPGPNQVEDKQLTLLKTKAEYYKGRLYIMEKFTVERFEQ